ncbi:MAG: DNA polymerase III subunit gamma/tau, partial [Verrucomicrobiota bacterium]|nr:DNA polymerase III subunit gamma/tau [Verrucomicrobiota bacterium]
MTQKYQVLARRYRPQTFADVVGQGPILQTLKNALKRGFIAHAYLFAGSRGVGKTTLARLFAKALNCASPSPDGEPCNQCPSCHDISSGQSLDVIEIDGASNRGIDDIRQINETVAFAPSHGKYKIYIIDEVHMLTKEAFNALLKTLEEPPEKAKFFFATTEPHKVLPTIISRCQRFDLGRLLPSQIAAKLASIAQDLQRTVEPDALHLLSHYADGSLRDAESLFDQILCFSDGPITAADIQHALGLAPQEFFFALDQAFADSRFSFAFELAQQLFQSGKDFHHFLEQLIEHYRHLTLCKTLGESALSFPPEQTARYATSARYYTQPQCLAILDLLLKAEPQLAKSASPRTALELTLLQILRLKHRIPVEALVRRLSDLEDSLRTAIPP